MGENFVSLFYETLNMSMWQFAVLHPYTVTLFPSHNYGLTTGSFFTSHMTSISWNLNVLWKKNWHAFMHAITFHSHDIDFSKDSLATTGNSSYSDGVHSIWSKSINSEVSVVSIHLKLYYSFLSCMYGAYLSVLMQFKLTTGRICAAERVWYADVARPFCCAVRVSNKRLTAWWVRVMPFHCRPLHPGGCSGPSVHALSHYRWIRACQKIKSPPPSSEDEGVAGESVVVSRILLSEYQRCLVCYAHRRTRSDEVGTGFIVICGENIGIGVV